MLPGEERRWKRLRDFLLANCDGVSKEDWDLLWFKVCENFPEGGVDVYHNIDHVLTVTEYCTQISKTTIVGSTVVGLLHDIGRIDETRAKKEGKVVKHAPVSAKKARIILEQLPSLAKLLDIEEIIEAIAKHSNLNDLNDSQLTSDLQDADRLGAIGSIWDQVGRTICGCFTEKGLYNPDNPFCFGQRLIPGRCETVLGEVLCNLEWFLFLRNKKAKEIATPCIVFILDLLQGLAKNQAIEWKTVLNEQPFIGKVTESLLNS